MKYPKQLFYPLLVLSSIFFLELKSQVIDRIEIDLGTSLNKNRFEEAKLPTPFSQNMIPNINKRAFVTEGFTYKGTNQFRLRAIKDIRLVNNIFIYTGIGVNFSFLSFEADSIGLREFRENNLLVENCPDCARVYPVSVVSMKEFNGFLEVPLMISYNSDYLDFFGGINFKAVGLYSSQIFDQEKNSTLTHVSIRSITNYYIQERALMSYVFGLRKIISNKIKGSISYEYDSKLKDSFVNIGINFYMKSE